MEWLMGACGGLIFGSLLGCAILGLPLWGALLLGVAAIVLYIAIASQKAEQERQAEWKRAIQRRG